MATGYSGRSRGEVEDELNRYYEWYDIDRIFLDQQSASTGQVGYYEELYEYVKDQSGSSSSSIVVTNAGAPDPQAYIDTAEIIIVYENSALPGDVLQDYNKSHLACSRTAQALAKANTTICTSKWATTSTSLSTRHGWR